MAKGNEIIVSAEPGGRFHEGIITGTPSPGTVMQIDVSESAEQGRFYWEVYNPGTDGNQRVIAVLDYNHLEGKTATDAYAAGERAYLYFPQMGDELNMLVYAAGTGTGDALAVGDVLIVDDGTGTLVATTGTPESEPFIALEAVTDLTATAQLVHCMFTGY